MVADVFAAAVVEALKIQCSYDVSKERTYICDDASTASTIVYEIGAVLALVGKQFSGSISISYSKTLYLALIGAILRQKFDEISSDLEDGAGELLNMIFGVAKAKLEADHGYSFKSAIPTIIVGPNIHMRALTAHAQIAVQFKGKDGPFEIRVSAGNDQNS